VEVVNTDGSLAGSFWAGDLSQLSGGSNGTSTLNSTPRSLVFGSSNQNVGIYASTRSGQLSEFFKQPTSQWGVVNVSSASGTGVSPLLISGTIQLYQTRGDGHLLQFSQPNASAGSGGWPGLDVTQLTGVSSLLADPAAIFVPQSGSVLVFDFF
jgi:hypothetical protein